MLEEKMARVQVLDVGGCVMVVRKSGVGKLWWWGGELWQKVKWTAEDAAQFHSPITKTSPEPQNAIISHPDIGRSNSKTPNIH